MSEHPSWKILHLDLAVGLPNIQPVPNSGGVFLVFWWKDVPLGQVVLHNDRLPLPSGAVREMALEIVTVSVGDRLYEKGFQARLPEHVPPPVEPPDTAALSSVLHPFEVAAERIVEMERSAPAGSTAIIICTHERPEALRSCLESLRGLESAPDEIIVVDNNPLTDGTRHAVDESRRQLPILRYVAEPRPGLSAARNAGISASTAEFIVFTDDDVRVHSKWLARLRAAFTSERVMATTGLVLPIELETEAQQLFQWNHGAGEWGYRALTFDRSFLDRTRWRGSPTWHIGAGASMAFRREIFDRIGGFDQRLGAGASGCSEDSEIWYRIIESGYVCRYEPASVVFHMHRRSLGQLERQLHDYMRGHVTALLAQFERHRHPGDLLRATFWLPRYYAGWAVRRLLRRRGGPSLLRAQIQGFLRGFGYYASHRRDPAVPMLKRPGEGP